MFRLTRCQDGGRWRGTFPAPRQRVHPVTCASLPLSGPRSRLNMPLAVVSPRSLAAGVPILWGCFSSCPGHFISLDILCTRHSLRLDGLLPLGKRPPGRPLCCDAVRRCLDRRKCPVSLSLQASGFALRIKQFTFSTSTFGLPFGGLGSNDPAP